jgi:adenylate cyclase
MLALFYLWLKAGSQHATTDTLSALRRSNLATLVLALTLLAQIPLMFVYWQHGGALQCLINLSTIACCPIVVLLNQKGSLLLAKFTLILIFISYLLATSAYLGPDANVFYFFLLGIFTSPFLFENENPLLSKIVILLFGTLTLLFAFFPLDLNYLNSPYVALVRSSNLINLVLGGLLCAFFIQRNKQLEREKLRKEQRLSERLLLNILPSAIALRLKQSNQPVADYFDQASILFADISNFSELSRHLSALKLVCLLNEIYSEFDLILRHHHLEKIKTMGDEIMAVCGVPELDSCHARQACRCALRLQQSFNQLCKTHNMCNGLRIGINTGPVVAGVIGKSKFSYDLWGEAVNLASRMESYGQSHKIQITDSTYHLIKNDFVCLPRGKINVKGTGLVHSYWLLAEKRHPNEKKARHTAHC